MNTSQKTKTLVTTAVFAALITLVTGYFLHIPIPTGGYLHLGDTLIYLAASLLPSPWAMAAASIGAGLADLLLAPMWVLPTVVIKAVVALQFTRKGCRILCPRNLLAAAATLLVSPTLYSLANCILAGTWKAFLPQFWPTMVQAVGSGVVFLALGLILDRTDFKSRLQKVLGV